MTHRPICCGTKKKKSRAHNLRNSKNFENTRERGIPQPYEGGLYRHKKFGSLKGFWEKNATRKEKLRRGCPDTRHCRRRYLTVSWQCPLIFWWMRWSKGMGTRCSPKSGLLARTQRLNKFWSSSKNPRTYSPVGVLSDKWKTIQNFVLKVNQFQKWKILPPPENTFEDVKTFPSLFPSNWYFENLNSKEQGRGRRGSTKNLDIGQVWRQESSNFDWPNYKRADGDFENVNKIPQEFKRIAWFST